MFRFPVSRSLEMRQAFKFNPFIPEVQVHATCVKVGYQIRFINKFCESTRTNLRRGQGSRAKFDDSFKYFKVYQIGHVESILRGTLILSLKVLNGVYFPVRLDLCHHGHRAETVAQRAHAGQRCAPKGSPKADPKIMLSIVFLNPNFLTRVHGFSLWITHDYIYCDIIHILYIYHHIMDSWLQSMCRRIASVASSSTRCTREMSRTRFCCRLGRRKLKFEARIGKLCRRCDLSCSNPEICRLVDLSTCPWFKLPHHFPDFPDFPVPIVP